MLRRDLKLRDLLARPAFRSLYYHRIKTGNRVWPGLPMGWRPGRSLVSARCTSTLTTSAPGCSFSTASPPSSRPNGSGANCWINQQVTIGYDETERRPTLEDGVTVNAGAQVIGGVTLHAGCRIGANAVVVRDVPPGVTAVGVPAHRSR